MTLSTLHKKDKQMANNHMKGYSSPLVLREMHTKNTTKKYHHILIRMAKIKETDYTKCRQGCGQTNWYTLLLGR